MPQNQSSNTIRAIKFITFIAITAAASAGATLAFREYVGPATATAHDTASPPSALPAPIFLSLDPFTVTLAGEYKSRVLYVAMTLRLGEHASAAMIDTYMPEVRDRALRLLSQQNAQDIQTPDGRQALVDALRSELALPYTQESQGPRIVDVLFTAFVIQ